MATCITANVLSLAGSNRQLVLLPTSTLCLYPVVYTRFREVYEDRVGEIHVCSDSGRIMDRQPMDRVSFPFTYLAEPAMLRPVLREALRHQVEDYSLDQLASRLLDYVVGSSQLLLEAKVEVVCETFVDEEDAMQEEDEEKGAKESGGLDSKGREMRTCSVCLEGLRRKLIRTACSHLYHRSCLASWLERNNSCPVCRTPLQ